jgi:predicted RNase H-like HicB family nuclease
MKEAIELHLEGLQENGDPAPYPVFASEFIEALAA